MDRAQAAVLYGRLKGVLSGGSQTPAGPEQPVESEQPEPPETPAAPSNVVGTISSTPVTLSLDTHKPIVDYWSEQSDEIRALADKDRFNAAVDTLVHSDTIIHEGELVGTVNKYYNYAVFTKDITDGTVNVTRAMSSLYGYGTQFPLKLTKEFGYFSVRPISDERNAIFAPIFAQFTDDMSDREKVEICVKAVCDRFDYEVNGGFSWTNGKTTGDCDDFSSAIEQIVGAAGIPCYQLNGKVRDGAHAWNHVFIDGTWYALDGGAADVGHPIILTMSQHEELYGYPHSTNTRDVTLVTQALVETAERYR